MPYTIPFYQYTTGRFGDFESWRSNPHRGHDVAPGRGVKFPSWVAGKVVAVYRHTCLGLVVVVQNRDDGYYVSISHLDSNLVSVGAQVEIGTPLGTIGNTGSCTTGAHGHIAVSPSSARPESGPVVDPVQYANNALGGGGSTSGLGYGLTFNAQLSLQRAMSHTGRYSGIHDGAFGDMSVKGMQQWLIDLGYLPWNYAVDGQPGPTYGKALQSLARDKGGYTGPIDGVLGQKSSDALIHWAEIVVIQNGGGTALHWGYGMDMETQRLMQAALAEIGYYGGVIDGVYGPRAVAATQAYLKWRGLLPETYGVDGNPGVLYGVALQKLAADHGYTGAQDGVIGAETCVALRAFAESVLDLDTEPPPQPEPEPGCWPTTGSFGIDIASPQRDIDLVKAKAEGVQYAIIKMGGLNVTPQYVAPFYETLVKRARSAGLPVGHYYLIGLGQTPEQQAEFFVENLVDFRVDEDILALDNEKLDSNGTLWDDAATARFAAEVKRLTGIDVYRRWNYGGAFDYRKLAPWPLLEAEKVRFWWAAYGENTGCRDHDPSLQGALSKYDIHQFSSLVNIAGYKLDGNWSPHTVDVLFAKGTVGTTPPTEPEPEPEPPTDRLPEFLAKLNGIMPSLAAAHNSEGDQIAEIEGLIESYQ